MIFSGQILGFEFDTILHAMEEEEEEEFDTNSRDTERWKSFFLYFHLSIALFYFITFIAQYFANLVYLIHAPGIYCYIRIALPIQKQSPF